MIWSSWQGAIGRGAVLGLLFWSGLAWTQTAGPQSANEATERIMVVHEGGKSTRCRVLECWQLPDQRVAHLLQALETSELVTIVDDQAPTNLSAPGASNPRAMPKRIFFWGPGRQTPPDGSPVPPNLRLGSSALTQKKLPAPSEPSTDNGPVVINQLVDNTPLGTPVMLEKPAPSVPDVTQSKRPQPSGPERPEIQALEFNVPPMNTVPGSIPAPLPTIEIAALTGIPSIPAPPGLGCDPCGTAVMPYRPGLFPRVQAMTARFKADLGLTTGARMQPGFGAGGMASDGAACAATGVGPCVSSSSSYQLQTRPCAKLVGMPSGASAMNSGRTTIISPKNGHDADPILGNEGIIRSDTGPKKSWRPGDKLSAWLSPKASTGSIKPSDLKPAEPMPIDTKLQKGEEFLAIENKQAQKKLDERVEKAPKTPFSTAMSTTTLPSVAGPDMKKAAPDALAIPGPKAGDEKVVLPPPPAQQPAERRDMWGNTLSAPVVPPGKSLLDQALKPAESSKTTMPPRREDPLLAPERLVSGDARLALGKPTQPVSRTAGAEPKAPPQEWTAGASPYPSAGLPLNAQSVLAARSGIQGPVVFIPVHTVTVPQPYNPPQPPPPVGLEAPQLNAYVNAFTPPPPPKNAPPQAGAPMVNPMMSQQMMQQQMLAQYLMQQQMLAQQMMPSTGPMNNVGRHYNGPMPPNHFGGNATPPMGHMSMPYPSMMQPTSYPQMPTQPVTSQVEPMIKVLRESPYPMQREWAAQTLANFDWRVHPQLIQALLAAASQDPAANVRAICVSNLGRMQAAMEPVLAVLHSMRHDTDPRVRQEVEQALFRLGSR